MTTVSVALCTRNGERFIATQLASILAQTRPVDEIVIGDDGSTDQTLDIIGAVATGSTVPIHVRPHDPLGVAGNFADAIGATTGDVVVLSDQDDVWHHDRLERLLPALDGVDLVHSDARLVDANGTPLSATLLESLEASPWERDRLRYGGAFDALLRRNLVTGATALVRGEVARAAMPIPDGWIHDEWLAIVCALGGGVRLVPEPTIDYRQHDANAIGVRRLSIAEKFGRLVQDDDGASARKAKRAMSLARVAADRGLGSPAQRAQLVDKARAERARAALPRRRLARIPLVARAAIRGRYATYARGMLDVVRDLVQARSE